MRFVCPKLEQWVTVYIMMNDAWTEAGCPGVPPPIPPTTDMWASTTDDEKEYRWVVMWEWLSGLDVESCIDLADSDWYVTRVEYIDECCSSRHSPYGRDPLLKR
jgi:hypothetical protein